MMRGTFANIRIRNKLVPGVEGGYTVYHPTGEQETIYDAAMRYKKDQVPTIILAGKEYGSGSSRDWAAKGPNLQGVRAVIAESFERIHRSNLIGMGILALQYKEGSNAETLGLTGKECFTILLEDDVKPRQDIPIIAKKETAKRYGLRCFAASIRLMKWIISKQGVFCIMYYGKCSTRINRLLPKRL